MKSLMLLLMAGLLAGSGPAQPVPDWDFGYDLAGTHYTVVTAVEVDPWGNVVMTGSAGDNEYGLDYTMITMKLTPDGDTLWVRPYYTDSLSRADDLVIDADGYIYVVGRGSFAAYGEVLPLIIKYAPDGSIVWVRDGFAAGVPVYPGGLSEVALDGDGHLCAVGQANDGTGGKVFVCRYGTDGAFYWNLLTDFAPLNGIWGQHVAIGPTGNICLVAQEPHGFGSYDIITAMVTSTGASMWAHSFSGEGENFDYATDVAAAPDGGVYVTAYIESDITRYDWGVLKYSSTGTLLWSDIWDGGGQYGDEATAVEVASNGDVIVAGQTVPTPTSIAQPCLARYTPTGTRLWLTPHDVGGSAWIHDMVLDDNDNAYLGGYYFGSNHKADFLTVGFAADGSYLWDVSYEGPVDGDDIGQKIALNGSSIYVGGYIAMDNDAVVDRDMALVAYTIPTCCVLRGDVDHSGALNVSDLTYLVEYLFQGGPAAPCEEEGDVDGSGAINVSDLTFLVEYLFQGGQLPPPC